MKKTYYPLPDETVYRTELENGLTVAVVPKRGFTKKIAYFVTDYGSIHQDFIYEGEKYHVPAGIAHYLEHKMFDLPGDRDVSAEFASFGAMVNAFTSYDITAYYFSCTDNFEKCLDLLLEFVSTPYFTAESVAKEQGIIDQEIGMNRDNPDSRVFDNLMESMYRKHPVHVPILGDEASIREITPETLHLVHKAFYNPRNMMLCVVGDVDADDVAAIARKRLGDTSAPMGEKCRSWDEPLTVYRQSVSENMEVSMPNFILGFKCSFPGLGENAIREEMIADLAAEALFGESSELYLKLYEEGLIDSSFGGGFETLDSCAFLSCGGDSDDPETVKEAIIRQAEMLCEAGIDEESFHRSKRSALGRRIRGLDSFDGTAYRVCAYHLSEFDYFRFPEIYASIEKQDVEDFLRRTVHRENAAISVINPIAERNEL